MEHLDTQELIEEIKDVKLKLEDCLNRLNNNQELDSTQIGFLQSIDVL